MGGVDACHTSVLLNETVEALSLEQGLRVIDATVGHGGHAEKIMENIGHEGRLLAIDCDFSNLEKARQRLSHYKKQIIFVHSHFDQLERIAHEHDFFRHLILMIRRGALVFYITGLLICALIRRLSKSGHAILFKTLQKII